ncbi:MAG: FecR domain-containing protein [Pseudomonadota bacterium]
MHVQHRLHATAALLLCIGLTMQTMAGESPYLELKEASGEVTMTLNGHDQPGQPGLKFSPPAGVRTGPTGSAVIVQGETIIRVTPGSVIAIPVSSTANAVMDRVEQQSGSALYNVKGRQGRRFSVQTPYLTSVVKGTLFSITVEHERSTVALLEGSLEVRGLEAGTPALLKSGDTARLARGETQIAVERAAPTSLTFTPFKEAERSRDSLGTDGVVSIAQDLSQITADFRPALVPAASTAGTPVSGSTAAPLAQPGASAPGTTSSAPSVATPGSGTTTAATTPITASPPPTGGSSATQSTATPAGNNTVSTSTASPSATPSVTTNTGDDKEAKDKKEKDEKDKADKEKADKEKADKEKKEKENDRSNRYRKGG